MSNNQESKRRILDALRQRNPFPDATAPAEYRPMVPRTDDNSQTLAAQFMLAAEALACEVYQVPDETQALQTVLDLLQGVSTIAAWDPGEIRLPGLRNALHEAGIRLTNPDDKADEAQAEVGLSGAEAGLAATGSLVLASGPGQYRTASLLPPVHIAILHTSQIVADLESWFAYHRRNNFLHMRQSSTIVVISGPSRTADIAMQLVMGMHGPREVKVVVVGESETGD
jgi:L-lactate utilization protein LutC